VEGPGTNLESLRAFLREELLPHAHAEELHLYPAVDPIIKERGKPTATMVIDHEFISRTIHRIEDEILALERGAPTDEGTRVKRELDRLLLALEAVVALHMDKEERVYLPLLEQHLDEQSLRRVIDDMERRERTEALAT